ncbi:hypothetical protein NEFER03_0966 [Nematocida sp. LUAm3]|nr:hypothetical protein NEFER03_0803 [Nematocida sp. LUAm3]KAI5171661.1 hypothetical protein NEFER03_0966 [Nematocida sp. LUAm3]KAI5175430.1 hypothetical protein NEFER02_1359 [Nematocida sp. LUAm2]KAI5177613.1 hypothetical protein NEFER01_0837 [Nematocida sp. LUAm1]
MTCNWHRHVLFLGFVGVLCFTGSSAYKTQPDSRVAFLNAHPVEFDPVSREAHARYLDKPVPKIIHQIWFGNRERLNRLASVPKWREYCKTFGWKYMLWTEESEKVYEKFCKKRNIALINHLRQERVFCAASDVLRYELLNKYGGVYLDCDMQPPMYRGKNISLFDCFSSTGISVMSENTMRNTGNIGLFITNGLIFCPKGDPRINAAVNQVHRNYVAYSTATRTNNPSFITGPFFFNKILFGPFSTFSARYCEFLNIWIRTR